MSRRHIDVERVLGRLRRRTKLSSDDIGVVRGVLEEEPVDPDLVGSTVVAQKLGIRPTHVSRMVKSGRLPTPVPIEGSANGFYRADIDRLAAERAQEQAERAEREANESNEGTK